MNGLFQIKKHTWGRGGEGGGLRTGYLKNNMWKRQGPRKGSYRGDQKKIMWNFQQVLDIGLAV